MAINTNASSKYGRTSSQRTIRMCANTNVSIKTRDDVCKESCTLDESRQNGDDLRLLVELDFVVSGEYQ